MTDAGRVEFLRRLRTSVIADLIESSFDEQEAAALADARLAAAFPSGHMAPGHHVCCVMPDDCEVGHVWFGPDPGSTEGRWWLLNSKSMTHTVVEASAHASSRSSNLK
jgi:hypothetical protein